MEGKNIMNDYVQNDKVATLTNKQTYVVSSGTVDNELGDIVDTAKTSMSVDLKTATGCTFSKVGTAELAQPLLKGSAKVYTQGVYYFVSDSKDR